MKLIDKHYKWMDKEKLNNIGLCSCLNKTKYANSLSLFKPIKVELFPRLADRFWAHGGISIDHTALQAALEYTPLRQTIVLFICAMNNEL